MSASEPISCATSTHSGCSTCRRENASSLPVSSAARCVARIAAATSCVVAPSASTGPLSSSTCRLPWMTVEQVVEVVRDAAGQLADRLETMRMGQRLLGLRALQARREQARQRLDEARSRRRRSGRPTSRGPPRRRSPRRDRRPGRAGRCAGRVHRSRRGDRSASRRRVASRPACARATRSPASSPGAFATCRLAIPGRPTSAATSKARRAASSRKTAAHSTSSAWIASRGHVAQQQACVSRASTASRPNCARWSL